MGAYTSQPKKERSLKWGVIRIMAEGIGIIAILASYGYAGTATIFAVLGISFYATHLAFKSNQTKNQKTVIGVVFILYSSIAMYWSAYAYYQPELYWLFVPTSLVAVVFFFVGSFFVSLDFDDSMTAKSIAQENVDNIEKNLQKISRRMENASEEAKNNSSGAKRND